MQFASDTIRVGGFFDVTIGFLLLLAINLIIKLHMYTKSELENTKGKIYMEYVIKTENLSKQYGESTVVD